jgi:hypothetical protein
MSTIHLAILGKHRKPLFYTHPEEQSLEQILVVFKRNFTFAVYPHKDELAKITQLRSITQNCRIILEKVKVTHLQTHILKGN